MPNIAIMLSAPSTIKGRLYLCGMACVNSGVDSETIGWSTDVDWNSLPIDINKAIVNAAIAEAVKRGYNVGLLDVKMLFSTVGVISV